MLRFFLNFALPHLLKLAAWESAIFIAPYINKSLWSEAVIKKYSEKKLFWKSLQNFQENKDAKIYFVDLDCQNTVF